MVIPALLLKIRSFLTMLTDALLVGRKAGAWSIEDGMSGRFMVGNHAPQPLLGGVKSAIKGKIVEAGIRNIQKKVDTLEERKVIIDGIHVPGLPARFTWLLSGLGAVVMALMEASSHTDPALLVSGDIKGWVVLVFHSVDWGSLWNGASAFIGLKIAFWTRQDSHNATAVIPTEAAKGIAGEIQ